MALALYRKYRPQTFAEVVGQEHVSRTLLGEVTTGKIAHAYLFSGPRGTGKTSVARILAKAVNCVAKSKEQRAKSKIDGEPCNACEACTAITSGRALDVIEIDAASHRGIDTVRDTIISTARFAPSRFAYKLFILDEAHMLTNEAWNALLKIIEEPPAHLIFIFATTEAHKVPATILSRCQRFDFRRIASKDLVQCLTVITKKEEVKVQENVLHAIARLSEGCLRDAEGLLDQLLSLGEKEISEDLAALVIPKSNFPLGCDLLEDIIAGNSQEGLARISRAVDQGVDLSQWCNDITEALRYMILIKTYGDAASDLGIENGILERLRPLCQRADLGRILRLVNLFSEAKQALKNTAILQLPLEVAVVEGSGLEMRPGAVISPLQGSSSAPPQFWDKRGKIAAGAADARSAARTQPSGASLRIKDDNKNSSRYPDGNRGGKPVLPENSVAIELDEIKKKWPEVLKKAELANHSLLFLLSTSQPVEIQEGMLSVGVQYPFHRDKLNEQRCRTILEGIVREVYKAQFKVESVLQENLAASADTAKEVAEVFGGAVVE